MAKKNLSQNKYWSTTNFVLSSDELFNFSNGSNNNLEFKTGTKVLNGVLLQINWVVSI